MKINEEDEYDDKMKRERLWATFLCVGLIKKPINLWEKCAWSGRQKEEEKDRAYMNCINNDRSLYFPPLFS